MFFWKFTLFLAFIVITEESYFGQICNFRGKEQIFLQTINLKIYQSLQLTYFVIKVTSTFFIEFISLKN